MPEEKSGIHTIVEATLPEFRPPPNARPRQGAVAEAAESFAFLAPAGVLAAAAAKRYIPDLDATELAAISSFVSLGGSYLLSRLRDLRWRGRSNGSA